MRFYKFLFGEKRNKLTEKIYNFIESEFPELYKKIVNLKYTDHRKLAVYLQKKESDAIIGNVTKYAMKNNHFILTIHDSIMTTEESVEDLSRAMVNSFKTLYGLTPKLKIKRF